MTARDSDDRFDPEPEPNQSPKKPTICNSCLQGASARNENPNIRSRMKTSKKVIPPTAANDGPTPNRVMGLTRLSTTGAARPRNVNREGRRKTRQRRPGDGPIGGSRTCSNQLAANFDSAIVITVGDVLRQVWDFWKRAPFSGLGKGSHKFAAVLRISRALFTGQFFGDIKSGIKRK